LPFFVSILVFLEVPLQHDLGRLEGDPEIMFQSLFFWKFHCNVLACPTITMISLVSILVFLEVPLQLVVVLQPGLAIVCFNPCFSGSSTATAIELIFLQFQSL